MKKPALLLAALVVFVGAAALFTARPKDSVASDRAFIEEMIPHHEEAVSSSREVLAVAKDADVRKIAGAIVGAQDKEIATMKGWYSEWFGKPYAPTGVYRSMMKPISGLSVSEAERTYVTGMIAHHEHAVAMAEDIRKTTSRAELKNLANDVVRTQTAEIGELRALLSTRYGGKADAVDHSAHGM